jgi:hypothetical protein
MFVVGAAEDLPDVFEGLADEVAVRFPWGSLLRGALSGDGPVAAGLVEVLRPGGELTLLLALQPKDGFDDLLPLVSEPARLAERLAEVYGPLGMVIADVRWATADEVAASRSSWARKLRVGRDRQALLAVLRRT